MNCLSLEFSSFLEGLRSAWDLGWIAGDFHVDLKVCLIRMCLGCAVSLDLGNISIDSRSMLSQILRHFIANMCPSLLPGGANK